MAKKIEIGEQYSLSLKDYHEDTLLMLAGYKGWKGETNWRWVRTQPHYIPKLPHKCSKYTLF